MFNFPTLISNIELIIVPVPVLLTVILTVSVILVVFIGIILYAEPPQAIAGPSSLEKYALFPKHKQKEKEESREIADIVYAIIPANTRAVTTNNIVIPIRNRSYFFFDQLDTTGCKTLDAIKLDTLVKLSVYGRSYEGYVIQSSFPATPALVPGSPNETDFVNRRSFHADISVKRLSTNITTMGLPFTYIVRSPFHASIAYSGQEAREPPI